MSESLGLLLVTMEPAALTEDEFNDWYDTDHLPGRLAVPGFLSGVRFVTRPPTVPRYLALYDLADPGVLDSEAYRRISGPNDTPWTHRVLGRVGGYLRIGLAQRHPGAARLRPDTETLLVAFAAHARVPEHVPTAIPAGATQLRWFAAPDGTAAALVLESPAAEAPDPSDPAVDAVLAAGGPWDWVRRYARYRRRAG
jgi:hypothetical protein